MSFLCLQFLPKMNENMSHRSKNKFIFSFFGIIHGLTICFRNYLTFRLCNRKKRIMVPFFQSSDLMSRSIYTYFRMTLLYSWATYQYYEDPLVFTGKVMKYDIWSWGWVQRSPYQNPSRWLSCPGNILNRKEPTVFQQNTKRYVM